MSNRRKTFSAWAIGLTLAIIAIYATTKSESASLQTEQQQLDSLANNHVFVLKEKHYTYLHTGLQALVVVLERDDGLRFPYQVREETTYQKWIIVLVGEKVTLHPVVKARVVALDVKRIP